MMVTLVIGGDGIPVNVHNFWGSTFTPYLDIILPRTGTHIHQK